MKRHLSLLLVTAALPALFLAPPAAAQEGAAAVADVVVVGSQVDLRPAYPGGQVATGGRVGMFGALDVMDTPFSTTNYTEELMRNQQARSVADVLQNEPTVRVAKGFGNFQELYVIRGFPVYSDDMTYNGVYGVLPRQFVAAEFLERVEVFHGATAFLNGAAPGGSGVGGAFNLVPKRAPSAPLTRATLGVQADSQLYGALDLSRRFGDGQAFGARLNLAHRNGEGAVDAEDLSLSVASLGLDYRGDRLRFSADLGYQDHRIDAPRPSVTPSGDAPAPPSADSNFAQPWTYTDERQLFGVVRGEFDVSDNVSAWAAIGGRKGEEQNVLSNPTSDAAGVTSAYRFDNLRKDEIASADAGVRLTLRTGGVGHRVVVSAASVQSKSRNAYAFSDFAGFAGDLYDPTPVAPPTPDFFVGGSMADPNVTERVRNTSVAVADMLEFMDGAFLATIGLRHQSVETETFDYNTGAFVSGYEGDAVTPALGLVYKPSERLSIYGNYAEALVPGATAPAVSGGAPVSNAGEVLDPFRGKQVEVGVKYDNGDFGGTVSLFRTDRQSAIVTGGVFAANGEQRNQGVEFTVYGQPAQGVRLLGGLTLIDAELTRTQGGASDGLAPIGVPDVQANANVEWDVPSLPDLTLEARAVYTGSQPVNAANTVDLDSSTRFDLGARYNLVLSDRSVVVRARFENVTGEDYWASTGGYPGANYLVLGAPRTFILSASVDF